MPSLFDRKGADDTVRAWVVGCAAGEEVYSIAMVLAEHAATLADSPPLQLFATDIDQRMHGTACMRCCSKSVTAVASGGADAAVPGVLGDRRARGGDPWVRGAGR